MFLVDAKEAVTVATSVLKELLAVTNTQGQSGADLRTAVGNFIADAQVLIQNDESGPPLTAIFQKAFTAGTTQPQFAHIADFANQITTTTLGATLMKTCLIELAVATQCRAIIDATFASRNQVNALKELINAQFAPLEEAIADQMDQMTYQALITLHAAIIAYLVSTEQPLPRLLNFEFFEIMPTLVQAYKLYSDASRADEVRAENSIVHPAFAPRIGIALSQ